MRFLDAIGVFFTEFGCVEMGNENKIGKTIQNREHKIVIMWDCD
jgi:hypothetical protein